MEPGFSEEDLVVLLARYDDPGNEQSPRRPPWTWSALTPAEAGAMARLVDVYVETYNHVHAVTEDDVIAPCWRLHPGLATELAVQVWLYYAAHLDTKATPMLAADFYGRHLPGFRSRIDRLLGRSPGECRAGQHRDTWRKGAEEMIGKQANPGANVVGGEQEIALLNGMHAGFSHVGGG